MVGRYVRYNDFLVSARVAEAWLRMEEDRFQQVQRLFEAALEQLPEFRPTFLQRAARGDASLIAEVEKLLAAHRDLGTFLEVQLVSDVETQPIYPQAYAGRMLKDRYYVSRELGSGGFAVVYLGADVHLHRKPVVIKVLRQKLDSSGWSRKKFRQECEALARINHPGIVGVLDHGETEDGMAFLVLEFVAGITLRSAMTGGPITPGRVSALLTQIARGLDAAHGQGVFHRDLKPENIMLRDLGNGAESPVIIDFGVATVTDSETGGNPMTRIAGSFPYMAPEQLQGRPVAASDVYALGVIAWEMIAGRRPLQADSPVDLYLKQKEGLKRAFDEPGISGPVERVLLRALAFNPEDRFPHAGEFAEALAHALSGRDLEEPQPRAISVSCVAEASPSVDELLRERLEPVGGAVPLDSGFYVVRSTDGEFQSAIARRDSIVLVKGARQVGKTSLLARGLQHARQAGARVIVTDFQKLSAGDLESAQKLLLTLAGSFADQLDLETFPETTWNAQLSPGINLERYLRRIVFAKVRVPIVWGLDEVDRLFSCAFGSEVFGLFRSWHNERALDPEGPWNRFTLAIAYATEAHLFITDLNQSPFNVGTRLALGDFSFDHVVELNRRYDSPLRSEPELARYFRLVGGHPYLLRRGLHEMVTRGVSLSDLEVQADRDEGPFGDHLRRVWVSLAQDASLCEAMGRVLQGKSCPTPETFYRLRSAGLISGDSAADARPRCELYTGYLRKLLV